MKECKIEKERAKTDAVKHCIYGPNAHSFIINATQNDVLWILELII